MYYSRKNSMLSPRNGHTLVVGIVARISGCTNQKELSLEDQVDHAKEEIAQCYDGAVEYRIIATKGKGERLDRPELAETEEMLRSRELDVLVAEDIGRMVRGTEAVHLCGIAVDHGTRVLAPNDCIDTADDSWEEDVISACRDHVGHNAHTSKRLKHKLMNRFQKHGGAVALPIAGYVKPKGAKTYDDWRKDDAATEIIREGLARLKTSLNCSAVSDYFNQVGFATGPHTRSKKWDGAKVRRFYKNRCLAGRPGRGFRHTVKHHETGRRVSVPNTESDPVFLDYPHLAHVDAAELEEVNSLLAAKNARWRRKDVNGTDPRWRVPRKRTRFPGQHARCWYCGSDFVWGGNGVTDNLMCSNSRRWGCWHSIGFNGILATERIVATITSELVNLQGFDEQFRELVIQAGQNGSDDSVRRCQQVQRDLESLAREKHNLVAAIAKCGPVPMLEDRVSELNAREADLNRQRHLLESQRHKPLHLPQSIEELQGLLEEQFQRLAIHSPEFGDLMRQMVPEIHVYAVRLLDGGNLLPRARVKLNLAGIVPDAQYLPEIGQLVTRVVTLDLFTEPPQRERIRDDAVRLRDQGLTQRDIVGRLTSERTHLPVVQKALALDRRMKEAGLDSPYVVLTEPPEDYDKLRRHKNPRYLFQPQEGYQQPAI